MKRLIFALFAVLVLSGMSCTRTIRPDPIPANCEPIGYEVCKSRAKWEGDPDDPRAWDNLGGDTVGASREETRTCETRRKALEQCLNRLEKAGIIVLP